MSRPLYYILDGHDPKPATDLDTWGQLHEVTDRRVALDVVNGWRVSTMFLGIDHGYRDSVPILFETMIFRDTATGLPDLDDYQERYATWDEAVAGHARAVALARTGEDRSGEV